jgi:putative hydrolase
MTWRHHLARAVLSCQSPSLVLVSSSGPFNPFEGLPFFGDLSKLLGQGRGVPWDAARSLALAVATDGQSEPNVDPSERIKLEQLARVAELHVAQVTGLPTAVGGRELSVMPVNRGLWATKTLDAYRPLLEKLAKSLSPPADPGAGTRPGGDLTGDDLERLAGDASIDDQLSAMIGPLLQAMQPTMVAMTAGSMVGHLARRSFGQYELPIPRPPGAELMLVVPNLDAFGAEWSLPSDDFRLWVSLHEITFHTLLGVPHVRDRLDDLIGRYASGFRNDPDALEEHLQGLGDVGDLADPSGDVLGQIQHILGEPDALLGAIQSDEQRALRPQLDALVAVLVGVVDHVMDSVGGRLTNSYGMLTEALRRRRVEAAEADRFVERLLGLELNQATYSRGAAFVDGVIERAGEDALSRLWTRDAMLPTPHEVDAPGLWLARIELPDQ